MVPAIATTKTPAKYDFRGSITRLQSSLFTLRAVLSNDDAKLASGGGSTFRVGFSRPTEFVWRVSHFRAPLSQGFSWREAILILDRFPVFPVGDDVRSLGLFEEMRLVTSSPTVKMRIAACDECALDLGSAERFS